jgi:hypothetical protein
VNPIEQVEESQGQGGGLAALFCIEMLFVQTAPNVCTVLGRDPTSFDALMLNQ